MKNEKKQPLSLDKPPSINNVLKSYKLERLIKKVRKKEKFDIVLLEYTFQSKILKYFPNSLKIIDTHDAITSRHSLKIHSEYNSYTKKQEAKALNRADIIIAIEQNDKKFFKKILGKNKKTTTIGHIQNIKKPIKHTSRKNILFVGFLNKGNRQATNFFIEKVFPKIKKKFPDSKFLIAGTICDIIKESKDIIKLGKLKNIEEAYSLADIIITPMFMQTGQSIKNIEALAHSIPLITTSFGAKGLEKGKNKAFLIADTAKQFAKQISRLFEDKKLYEKTSKNAHNFIKQYNKENLNNLKEIFKNEK